MSAKGGASNANSGNRISRCHIKFLRGDKDVELIREDGSKELHSLIKSSYTKAPATKLKVRSFNIP